MPSRRTLIAIPVAIAAASIAWIYAGRSRPEPLPVSPSRGGASPGRFRTSRGPPTPSPFRPAAFSRCGRRCRAIRPAFQRGRRSVPTGRDDGQRRRADRLDGDGWLDVFVAQGCPCLDDRTSDTYGQALSQQPRRQIRGRDQAAGVGFNGYGQGVAVGDYDGDGRDDLYVGGFGAGAPVSQQRRRHVLRRDATAAGVVGRAGRRVAPSPTSTAMATSTSTSSITWRTRSTSRAGPPSTATRCPARSAIARPRPSPPSPTCSTGTTATARSPTSAARRGSRLARGQWPRAWRSPTSTTTAGSTSSWPTTRRPTCSSATWAACDSRRSRRPGAWPTTSRGSSAPAWASPRATTTATAASTCSSRISTRRPAHSIATSAPGRFAGRRPPRPGLPAPSRSKLGFGDGIPGLTTTTAGSTCSSPTVTSTTSGRSASRTP